MVKTLVCGQKKSPIDILSGTRAWSGGDGGETDGCGGENGCCVAATDEELGDDVHEHV